MKTVASRSVTIATGVSTTVTTVAGDIVFVGSVSDTTFTQPAQQVTVGQFPTLNAFWSRVIRVTNQAVFCMRNGAYSVAFLLDAIAQMAVALENSLTWAPRITTQPADDTCTFAKGVLTSNGTIPNDGDTVTIGVDAGSKTYTFKTTLTPTEGQVLINGSAENALINLKRAIDHTGTPDTDYKCAAAHTQVKGGAITATTLQIISKTIGTAANSYATTTNASPRLAWGGSVMSGGTAAAAFTVVTASEYTPTYEWKESADGETYGSALTTTGIYDVSVAGTLTISPTDTSKDQYYYRCTITSAMARVQLRSTNVNVIDGETVTLGNKTYTFKDTVGTTEGNVHIGATADDSLLNLISAINHTGTPGTDYYCAAAHTQFVADVAVGTHAIWVTSLISGSFATTTTATSLSWPATTVASRSTDTDAVILTVT